jgi:hypothetical protein
MVKNHSTNGQYLFTLCDGITLIESRLKKAAALIYFRRFGFGSHLRYLEVIK